MKHLSWMIALCAVGSLYQPCAYAQAVTGSVLGTVTDASGAVVANAKVTLTEVNTSVSRSADTNTAETTPFPTFPKAATP